ncbi:Sjogren's syndrome/scleroderma autoantigen 1 family protein [Hyperthermus butylicus]|uniref:Conserved crenarchaeal protein n=1 Tax=Hyperthermus butylicus (strain DSM 5456 / JCM 9403 / PLM1-5) TaxID=415426 RepID=A2BN85_HYPBU|nr:Sjogren's syndrome/scleroderma autoantigen 1 family protein [Hyperthermus butylicus]ABM81446.1 conserved crenarchaeal protein [Hyperthermus butylicus DSM 5456]
MTTSVPRDPKVMKKMADLLRAGATMLAETCPICGLPLFRLRSGEIVCPIHGRVYIVRDESEAARVEVQGVLEELEKVVARSIGETLSREGLTAESLERLKDLLDVLERVERILALVRETRSSTNGESRRQTSTGRERRE